MTDRFKFSKFICGVIIAIALLFFVGVGVQTTWRKYVIRDYDKHLTAQVYTDSVVNQNVNLVFYRNGCPYCKAGKKTVITAAEKSLYPTFYIDVESEDGQALVKKYQIEKAASIIKIREGKSHLYTYATKNKTGQIEPDQMSIKEVFNDSKK